MHPMLRTLWGCFLLLFAFNAVQAAEQRFRLDATLTAMEGALSGVLTLHLEAGEAVFQPQLRVRSGAASATYPLGPMLDPGESHELRFDLAAEHPWPGRYHLLAEVLFRDKSGAWLNAPFALGYGFGDQPSAAPVSAPRLAIDDGRLSWGAAGADLAGAGLVTTAGPFWRLPKVLHAAAERIPLRAAGPSRGRPLPGREYAQLAELGWVADGVRHSRVIRWAVTGRALAGPEASSGIPFWAGLWAALLGGGLLGLALRRGPRRLAAALYAVLRRERLWGWAGACGLAVLVAVQLRIGLWFEDTLTTGGDTGSHLFYAFVFQEWLAQGKLSGWLPEVFMGFPAFRYYFPLPFLMIAALGAVTGTAIAFKWITLAPAVLLPLATYWLGGRLHWPVPARLLGVLGATAFLFTTATSIWGGNLLAVLAGEFAYAWGLLFTVLFWGALAWALEQGGRRWILAALLEVAVALCHGYGLLAAGFGALLFPLFARDPRRALYRVLAVHTLAFLLLGGFLFPLAENLPWTIPNDTVMRIADPQVLWPRTLWPLAAGLLVLPLLLWRAPESRPRLLPLFAIAALAALLFVLAPRLHLAEIRFYPFVEWALAVGLAAAVGWALWRWFPKPMLWALAAVIALPFAWQAEMQQVRDWSRWNLEGYEAKPHWAAFQRIVAELEGPLQAPRVAFEHDPANNDLGSTRNLEALPLFGTRPVLEGLYMESAISGPFIYQLQAEISHSPSSPLSRFPSVRGSVDEAVGHMRELYADTLLLRSAAKKALFRRDPRFEVLLEAPPFLLLRLREPVAMIEALQQPLVAQGREGWLQQAFRRFRLDFPYAERQVYLPPNQALPVVSPLQPGAEPAPRVLEMGRERLVFETHAPGRPHLIRMSYHPAWHSLGGEAVLLAEPCFMLIVPEGERVELVYGETPGERLGAWVSGLGLLALAAAGLMRRRAPRGQALDRTPLLPFAAVIVLIAGVGLWGHFTNPEVRYFAGHEHLSAQEWSEAAQRFEYAYRQRPVPARKAEALFWAARAWQFDGAMEKARTRYARLAADHPENYWAPEALFRLAEIADAEGAAAKRDQFIERLQHGYASNRWAEQARVRWGAGR